MYIAGDPELVQERLRAEQLFAQFNRSAAPDIEGRQALLEQLLGSLGADTEIRPPLYCDYGYQLHVGARTFVNFGLVALDVATISIGNDVEIGPNVQLLTPTHPVESEPRRAKFEAARPISIGDNVWLGGGAIVLPGVSIGPISSSGQVPSSPRISLITSWPWATRPGSSDISSCSPRNWASTRSVPGPSRLAACGSPRLTAR